VLIEGGIDLDQRLAHAHRGVVGVEHRLGLSEDYYTGSNDRPSYFLLL
jgi:hypothetical protein